MAKPNAPVAFGLLTVAGIMIYSGLHGISIADALAGSVGATLNPKGGSGGSSGGSGSDPATLSTGDATSGNFVSPFPKGFPVKWGRSDQGVDGVTAPGAPLRALADGTVSIASDPAGFGAKYPVLHGTPKGDFYYGHCIPRKTGAVKKGEIMATANLIGQGNAHTPGAFEIGQWPPGTMVAGNAIRAWVLALPRV